jgi:hypothetical protein
MKKLIIQSDSAQEDAIAAVRISDAIKKDEVDQVVWFSNMGQQIEKMKDIEKMSRKNAETLEFQNLIQNKLARDLSDLRFMVSDLRTDFGTMEKVIIQMVKPVKEKPSSKEEKPVKKEKTNETK